MRTLWNHHGSMQDDAEEVIEKIRNSNIGHRFEKEMTHVSATYSLREDGKIEVLNEGWKDGELKQIKGKAKQPDPDDPGKLKVSFFLWCYADY